MKKSTASKKGSCLSFMTGGGLKDQTSLQLIRISLKKEGDRKEKLEHLLSRYEQIRSSQKLHIKQIKSSIIELKDSQKIAKIKFFVDPNIYVDNNLSIQTREFLCLLLNTFYKRYEQNADYDRKMLKINQSIKKTIKNISHNEELLFKVQKTNINHQVQLEGQMLTEKSKLKEEGLKTKDLQNQQKRVMSIYQEHKNKFDEQKSRVDELLRVAQELENKIIGLNQKINEGETIRNGNEDKIFEQMTYQLKFEEEVNLLKQNITNQLQKEKELKKKILNKKISIQKLKKGQNIDRCKHEVQMKILNLHQPQQSNEVHNLSNIIQIEKSFAITMTQTFATFK